MFVLFSFRSKLEFIHYWCYCNYTSCLHDRNPSLFSALSILTAGVHGAYFFFDDCCLFWRAYFCWSVLFCSFVIIGCPLCSFTSPVFIFFSLLRCPFCTSAVLHGFVVFFCLNCARMLACLLACCLPFSLSHTLLLAYLTVFFFSPCIFLYVC